MIDEGLTPPGAIWHTALFGAIKNRNMELAKEIWELMPRCGFTPSAVMEQAYTQRTQMAAKEVPNPNTTKTDTEDVTAEADAHLHEDIQELLRPLPPQQTYEQQRREDKSWTKESEGAAQMNSNSPDVWQVLASFLQQNGSKQEENVAAATPAVAQSPPARKRSNKKK